MSFSSWRTRLSHKALVGRPAQDKIRHMHQSHHDSADEILGAKEVESRATMVAAGKKADAQREDRPARTDTASQLQPSPTISPSIALLTTALGLVSVSTPTLLSSSVSLLSTSPFLQPSAQKQTVSESLTPPQSTSSLGSASVTSSHSSLAHIPPALLAFILIFVCFFFLVMFLAFYRMCGHKQSRIQLASPLFLGNSTSLKPRPRLSVVKEDKPKMIARDAVVRFTQSIPGNIVEAKSNSLDKSKRGTTERAFFMHANALNAPLPVHVSDMVDPTRSRVLQSHAPRPYHRPRPAYTTNPESIMPLITGDGFRNGDYRKGKGSRSRTREEMKEKENIVQDSAVDHKSPGNTLRARSSNRSSRPLSAIPETLNSSGILNDRIETNAEALGSASVLTTVRHGDVECNVVPPLPTAGTVAVDIGLAMLTEFSSPNVGLGFDPHSMSDSPLPAAHIANGAAPDRNSRLSFPGEVRVLSYLVPSSSSGSNGLPYMASESSQNPVAKNTVDERDITEDDNDLFSALPQSEADQKLDPRAQAHARLVEQLNIAIDPEANRPNPAASSFFKAPTLPTLSEMALSRADPLYESVTNELFSSYGVRMSTGSATARISRVSARISRMLSWFGDAAPGERLSVGDSISGHADWMFEHEDRVSVAAVDGVQPLRIAKSRKSPS